MSAPMGSMTESIVRRGEVISVVRDRALIRLEPSPGCSACGNRGSCGSGDGRPRLIEMATPEHARAGDRVTVGIPGASLSLAAMLGYLLPSVALLAGAIAAQAVYPGDLAAVAGAGAGLTVGVLVARLIARFSLGNVAALATCQTDFLPGENA